MRTTGIWALALTTLIGSQSAIAADLPGKGIAVQPVQSTISEETFQTLLVSKALEKLGYDVKEPREVDYNVAYTSIASGDATFIAVNWDPLHADQYKAAGGDAKFYREGVYVNGAAQGYLIDKKTAEQYHITNVEQLKDPKIAKLFDTNGDGKADLTGCTGLGLRSGDQPPHQGLWPEQYRRAQPGQLRGDDRRHHHPLQRGQTGAVLHLDTVLGQ